MTKTVRTLDLSSSEGASAFDSGVRVPNHWMLDRTTLQKILDASPDCQEFAVWVDNGIISIGPHDAASQERVRKAVAP